MKIGLPKEVKNNEHRVGLTPESVGELSLNHDVFVQKNAGKAIGFTDEMYQACLLYTSPSPRDSLSSRMPSSA